MTCCWSLLFYGVIGFLLWKIWRWMRRGRLGDLPNRYIFITGCDSGFGNATARRLDSLGVNVFAACFTEKGESELTSSSSTRLKTVRLDVSDHNSIVKAYQYVETSLPSGKGLWGVLSNAGTMGQIGPCDWHTADDYYQIMKVNGFGSIDVVLTFLPLVKREKGRVVITSSETALLSLPFNSCYSSSKYVTEAFADALRREVWRFGVSVHVIEPGFFGTNIITKEGLKQHLKLSWEKAPEMVKKEYGLNYADKLISSVCGDIMAMAKPDITPVVDVYEEALIGHYPCARYVVGWDAFLKKIVQMLPECVSDRMLRIVMSKVPKPEAAIK